MKCLATMLMATMLAGCSSLGIHDPGPEQRAARNLCESMRSYRPYYPNQCGEHSGFMPWGYGYR